MHDITGIQNLRWQIPELEASFLHLTSIFELPLKFCFFIDGLDEFEGDLYHLSRALQNMCLCKDIKLCVSSRPWNVFDDAFGQDPARRLYIHELTRRDIQLYTESRLYEHPRWFSISARSSAVATLVTEITNKAMGVFLWVFLVTKMLREGLTNDDSITDLWKRLKTLPVDLEMFFKHILSSVEPFYHEKMAGTLLMALVAGPLPIEVYTYHDLEYEDADYALKQPIEAMHENECKASRSLTSRRLNGLCKGLVETRNNWVEFIHRTVKDFLQTRDIVIFLKERVANAFHPRLSIIKAYLAWTKRTKFLGAYFWAESDFSRRVHEIMKQATMIQVEGVLHHHSYERLLDDLETATINIMNIAQSGQLGFAKCRNGMQAARTWFREQLLIHDLGEYLSVKLSRDTGYFAEFEEAPLSIVLDEYAQSVLRHCGNSKAGNDNFEYYPGCSRVLACLTAHGEDLNEPIEALDEFMQITTTPWKAFINRLFRGCRGHQHAYNTYSEERQSTFTEILAKEMFSLLLHYRADPNAGVICPFLELEYKGLDIWPFWVVWLFVAFRMPALWRVSELYLQSLRVIFGSGADVGLMMNPDNPPWTIFCMELNNLANHDHPKGKFYSEQMELLAEVIIEFAKFSRGSSLPWRDIEPSLLCIFSHSQLRRIFQAPGRETENHSVKLRREAKRRASESYHATDMKKFRAT